MLNFYKNLYLLTAKWVKELLTQILSLKNKHCQMFPWMEMTNLIITIPNVWVSPMFKQIKLRTVLANK